MELAMYGNIVNDILLLVGCYFAVHHWHLDYRALAWVLVVCRYASDANDQEGCA
jgi:hypothetical protein